MKRLKMKCHYFLIFFVIFEYYLISPAYGGDVISAGMDLPQFDLSMQESPEVKQYLGVDDLKSFSVSQISAKLVFIEVFSTFCPHCHKNAPVLNTLYTIIQGDPDLSKDVRIIAVASGNKANQIEPYKAKFKVPFPIIEDPYLKVYKAIGSPGVPFMFLASNEGKVMMTHVGPIENLDETLGQIREFHKKP